MPLIDRIFIALCRQCIGEDSDTSCWQCQGDSMMIVDSEDEADLVLEPHLVTNAQGVGWQMHSRFTDRFKRWLREMQADE